MTNIPTKPLEPFPRLAEDVIERAVAEATEYLERDPADSLWLRVKRGDWCFDIIARPRFSAADAPFEPPALVYDSNQPGLKNK